MMKNILRPQIWMGMFSDMAAWLLLSPIEIKIGLVLNSYEPQIYTDFNGAN